MKRVWWFCAFGLAAIMSLFGLGLAAQSGDRAAIFQQLSAQIIVTKTAADRSDIVDAGSVVELRKEGLLMYGVASPLPPSNTYKNGKISQGWGGFGRNLLINMASAAGGNSASYPARNFVAGETCWVTGISVQKDGVVFQLYSDPYDDIRYYADLKIPFPQKKVVPPVDAVLQMVAEVLETRQQASPGDEQVPGSATLGNESPPAEGDAASVQGKYLRKGKSGDFLELSSDGVCSLLQDGHSVRGNYKVQGDTIIFTSPQIRGQTKARFIGDTIRDDDGIVWERASEPQEGADASDEKPLSVDDILKATAGLGGDASNEPGTKAPGSSGQTPPPGGGDASDEKPLSADDILRATSAGSVGDASSEPGTKSEGSAGQALQPGTSDTHLSKPFTNKDVTAPARAGLGDKIVIATPRSMPGGNRDTSTDALIHLKKAGVSKAAQGGSVQSVEGQYVRWNRGSLYGLRTGLQARIVRNGEPIATGRVIDVRPDDSDIELDTVSGLNDVVVGDTVEVK
jgi:hypothetical protein